MSRFYIELNYGEGKTSRAGPYPTAKMAEAMRRTYEPLFKCEGRVIEVDDES